MTHAELEAERDALRRDVSKLVFEAVESGRGLGGSVWGCRSTREKAAKYDADTQERADMILARWLARTAPTQEAATDAPAKEDAR